MTGPLVSEGVGDGEVDGVVLGDGVVEGVVLGVGDGEVEGVELGVDDGVVDGVVLGVGDGEVDGVVLGDGLVVDGVGDAVVDGLVGPGEVGTGGWGGVIFTTPVQKFVHSVRTPVHFFAASVLATGLPSFITGTVRMTRTWERASPKS
jgi:hypothetical protein